MKYYKYLSLAALALLISLTGCAGKSTPTHNSQTYTIKPKPLLTSAQMESLNSNGYSPGTWRKKCDDANSETQSIAIFNDNYEVKNFLSNKLLWTDLIYEVSSQNGSITEIKTKSKDGSGEFISSIRSGFANSSKMILDRKIYYTSAPNSTEIIKVKDGFDVSLNSDGKLVKGKPSPVFRKCD
jgi:hypothetical protein